MDYETSAAGQQTAGRQMRKTGTKNTSRQLAKAASKNKRRKTTVTGTRKRLKHHRENVCDLHDAANGTSFRQAQFV